MKDVNLPKKVIEEVDEYCSNNNLGNKEKKKIIEMVKEGYRNSLYDPQEAIGIVTAQSLSEPATQMTMRTYHFAGTAGIQVTLGLPRMLEIFDGRKEPTTPTMTIYILPEYQERGKVKKIAEEIKEVKVKNVITSFSMDVIEGIIKCKLDLKKLRRLDIKPENIVRFIRVRNAVVTLDNDTLLITLNKKDIKTLYKLKQTVLDTRIKGIKNIVQTVVAKKNGEWVITTLGSNLKKVLSIKGVDVTRTTTNNLFEIQDVFGIEAARNAIVNQTKYTMEEQGLNVDYRYIMLLADLMTVNGEIRSIGRYGISGQKASVLVRASFEETKKHVVGASIKGEIDLLKGTIENVMLNQIAPIGTGVFELIGHIQNKKKQTK